MYKILYGGGEGGVRTLAPLLRPNSLANCPLHHLGTSPYLTYDINYNTYLTICQVNLKNWFTKKRKSTFLGTLIMAEEVGFEPTVPFDITSFQDWLLKPLGHSSKLTTSIIISVFFYLSILFIIFYVYFEVLYKNW